MKTVVRQLSGEIEVDHPWLHPRDAVLGIHLEHACGGKCACTTCHVILQEGEEHLSEQQEEEEDELDNAPGLTMHSRLGCQAVVKGDLTILIPKYTINQA